MRSKLSKTFFYRYFPRLYVSASLFLILLLSGFKVPWYWILFVWFLLSALCCFFLAVRFSNPYKLYMVFGKKGSGKTTFLCKTAYNYLKRGRPVYCTEVIPGTIHFDVSDIGHYTFPENAVILIDEVGMIWDNRNFKSFRPEVRDYFKYQRHERHTVYLFSQTFDVDVKLRNLTDCMYLCTCHMGWLSVARRINRNIVVVQAEGDSESRIADNLEFAPLWTVLFGGKPFIFTFIPRWASMFDSHEKLGLEQLRNFELQEIPPSLRKQYKFAVKRRLPWIKFADFNHSDNVDDDTA